MITNRHSKHCLANAFCAGWTFPFFQSTPGAGEQVLIKALDTMALIDFCKNFVGASSKKNAMSFFQQSFF